MNYLSDTSANSLDWNIKDELKGLELDDILKQQLRVPYAVGVVNVDGSLNIGTMIRTAVIYGASDFFIFGKKKYDKRSTVGAQNYISIHKANLPDKEYDLYSYLINQGYFPVYIETCGKILTDRDLLQFHFAKEKNYCKPCFIFGSESEGIPYDLKNTPNVYKLPQYGVLRSLNVSSCAAIVMYKFVEVLATTK